MSENERPSGARSEDRSGARTGVSAQVAGAVAAAHDEHWSAVLATTLGLVRDLDLAEDSVQEAFLRALEVWERDGVPANPAGWLVIAARRRALDVIRRGETLRRKLPLLVWDEDTSDADASVEPTDADGPTPPRIEDETAPVVLDEQLRLIFLAAHPALAPEARIALTLRLVGGVSTADIAAAFLVSEATMAARLTRAKKRIRLSRIPCRVPDADQIDARVVDVLDVISVLIATGGMEDAAQRMLETLHELLPAQTEPQGLLAQTLSLRARDATRTDARGRPVALADQDRRRWDRDLLDRADALVLDGLSRGGRGPYLIQGAIAAAVALPARHEDVDWTEVLDLYDALLEHWPTAIVQLGRVVALAETAGPRSALHRLTPLAEDLAEHRPFHVIRGELLDRTGAHAEAADAFRTALACRGDEQADPLLLEMIANTEA